MRLYHQPVPSAGTRHGRHKVLKAATSRLVFRRGRTTGVARQIPERRAQWKRRPAAQQDCSEPQNTVAWGSSGPALAACEAMARNFPTGADRLAIVACRNRRAGDGIETPVDWVRHLTVKSRDGREGNLLTGLTDATASWDLLNSRRLWGVRRIEIARVGRPEPGYLYQHGLDVCLGKVCHTTWF